MNKDVQSGKGLAMLTRVGAYFCFVVFHLF
jgi:hypothetical protein